MYLRVLTGLLAVYWVAAEVSNLDPDQLVGENSQAAGRIVGGYFADIAELNYQASVQMKFNKEYRHFCGGTILTANHIVSAAHCFFE